MPTNIKAMINKLYKPLPNIMPVYVEDNKSQLFKILPFNGNQ